MSEEIFENENVEEYETIVLTDEDGNDIEFEFLDSFEHKGTAYVVLMSVEDEDDAVAIMEVEEGETENDDNLLTIEDAELLDELYQIFKERNSDFFDFED